MQTDTLEIDRPEDDRRTRETKWVLPALGLLGLVIFELTTQPALAVATVCVKFGWEDFRTALWLRRNDPDLRRARACFWLYLASGLWKTAVFGTVLMFAICWITLPMLIQRRAAGNQPPTEFMVAVMTAIIGFALSTLTTCVAMVKAWRGRIKLWLNSSVHQARRQNLWPPPDAARAQRNHAKKLVLTVLITMVCPIIIFAVIAAPLNGPNVDPGPLAVFLVLGLVVVAFIILVIREHLSRGLANWPSECWGIPDSQVTAITDVP